MKCTGMKDSFVLYTGYMEHMGLMDMEQRGVLLTALMTYVSGNELPDMDGVTQMAFSFIRSQIDRDTEKYEDTCKKRSEAGKTGGRPKANGFSEKAKKANGFSEKQTKAKKADNEYDTDTEYDTENVDENDKKENLKRKIFKPPTPNDVREYCEDKGYSVDADRFVDFYACKGWMVGKTKMKDWKAAVRNWARSNPQRQELTAEPKSVFDEWRDA